MADHALAAASLGLEQIRRGTFAEALFRDGEQLVGSHPVGIVLDDARARHGVALGQVHALDATRRSAHFTHRILAEPHRFAVAHGDHDVGIAVGQRREHELVVLVQRQRDLAALTLHDKLGKSGTLDDTALCDHDDILVLNALAGLQSLDGEHGGDSLLRLQPLQQVDDIGALGGPSCLRDAVRLDGVDASSGGEEEDIAMRIGDDDPFDVVLLLGRHADDPLTASSLGGIGILRLPFDIPGVGEGDDSVVPLDEILKDDLVFRLGDGGAPVVAVLVADGGHFLADDLVYALRIGQDLVVFLDRRGQLCQTELDLLPFQTGQSAERHGDDRLCLLVGEIEAVLEVRFRGRCVGGGADDGDDLVDVVDGDLIAFVDVFLAQGLGEIELHAVGDDARLVLDVDGEDLPEVEDLRLSADQGEHIDGAGILQLRIFIELI